MKKQLLLFLGIFVILLVIPSCSNSSKMSTYYVHEENVFLVPQVQSMKFEQGKFSILKGSTIYYNNEGAKQVAENLKLYFKESVNVDLRLSTDISSDISLIIDEDLNLQEEEYVLKITEKGISITSTGVAGINWGVQTLRQMLPYGNDNVKRIDFQYVMINDYPAFAYRGMHLDVGRHFKSVDFVKQYIDILSLHKINVFHWHLTEDQGWRIEIKSHPELTAKGSIRPRTVIGKNTGKYDDEVHKGFYTQEEIKEVVAYAAALGINVMPEIEMPGHSLAALTSHPELGCTGGPYEPAETWGVFDDVYCAGNEATFKLLEEVIDEVVELFPYEYIHIGGDECPKKEWEKCPKCQKRIADEGLGNEHDLQSYFIQRMEKYINSKGKRIVGWDEILEGGLAPNATVMSWRGVKGGVEAANQGHDVVMSPETPLYFNYYGTNYRSEVPLAIGGHNFLKRVYDFNPIPEGINEDSKKHIIGIQAALWSEYLPGEELTIRMLLPRLSALSEVAWTSPEEKNYDDFISRLTSSLIPIFINKSYIYSSHFCDVKWKMEKGEEGQGIVLFTDVSDAEIYFTLDGTEPTYESEQYVKGSIIEVEEGDAIRAISKHKYNCFPIIADVNFIVSKASGKSIELLSSPEDRYSPGAAALTDGSKGSPSFTEGYFGFQNERMVFVLDMEENASYSKVSISALQECFSWIFFPEHIKVSTSNDKKSFTKVAEESYTFDNIRTAKSKMFDLEFEKTNDRYLKFEIDQFKKFPDNSSDAKPFVFVDEVAVF